VWVCVKMENMKVMRPLSFMSRGECMLMLAMNRGVCSPVWPRQTVVDTSHPLNAVHKPATTGIVGNNVKKGKLATDDTERRIDCIKKTNKAVEEKHGAACSLVSSGTSHPPESSNAANQLSESTGIVGNNFRKRMTYRSHRKTIWSSARKA